MLSQFSLAVKVFSEKIHKKYGSTYSISNGAMSDNGIFHSLRIEERSAMAMPDCAGLCALYLGFVESTA